MSERKQYGLMHLFRLAKTYCFTVLLVILIRDDGVNTIS